MAIADLAAGQRTVTNFKALDLIPGARKRDRGTVQLSGLKAN
jgi:hypothetical protein